MPLIYTLIWCLRKILIRCFNFVLSDILIKCTDRSGYVFVHFGIMPAVSAGFSRSALLCLVHQPNILLRFAFFDPPTFNVLKF